MRDLDETDREILRLLLEDARRPYSDIAERVDLSPPAVSDRVERLRELGIIRAFTLDIDRTKLSGGVPVLVELDVDPVVAQGASDALASLDRVEHVFRTADESVVFSAIVANTEVVDLISEVLDLSNVRDVNVRLLAGSEWTPTLGEAELALTCAECGNTVTSEGESVTLDGKQYHFCCESCLANFTDRYERLQSEA